MTVHPQRQPDNASDEINLLAAGLDEERLLSRTPPQDMAAEQCVLGAMLLAPSAIDEVSAILSTADFYRPVHATIFDMIVVLHGKGDPADAITVAAALHEAGELVRVGGAPYLHTLIAAVPTAANGGHYARIVADRAVRRRLLEAGTRIVQLAYNQGGGRDLDDLLELSQQAVFGVSAGRAGTDFTPIADMWTPLLDEIEQAGQPQSQVVAPTGFADLDRLLGGGLGAGQLIIVAGRPGLGKSTAALDVARETAIRAGGVTAVFSLEMSKVEIAMRLLSAEARIPLHVLRSGHLSDSDWKRAERAMVDIGEAPLFLDDSPSMHLGEIRAKAIRLKQRHDLRLIVVDYLQLMSSPARTESRQQEVAELSRGLKLLAKEVQAPVIAVSQLNRGPEQRQNKLPLLSDLRESGSIEQDADVVILLHRDDYYDKESPRAGEADFIVAKHRNGPTDTITVAAQLHLSRFVDMAMS